LLIPDFDAINFRNGGPCKGVALMTGSERAYLAFAGVVAWAGLLLQLSITSNLSPSVAVAVGRMLVYFTVLTNLIVAVYYTTRLLLPAAAPTAWVMRPAVGTWVCMSITFVGLSYALLLQHLFSHVGVVWLADITLHYVTPLLALVYWLLFVPKGTLRWGHAPLWSSYIGAYAVFVLIRGSGTGLYPYPFIDITALGAQRAAVNGCAVLVAFYALGLLSVLTDHNWPGRRRPA
jgi:hypothetical protein